jgi:hypothetical protein
MPGVGCGPPLANFANFAARLMFAAERGRPHPLLDDLTNQRTSWVTKGFDALTSTAVP